MRFKDRSEAGRLLAQALGRHRDESCVIYALPRGGVPVAFEIARALHAPLDLMLVRKIGVPYQPELAMGAVAAGSPDTIKGLFSPQTPDQASYTISLYQLSGVDPKGKKTYKRVSYTVDSFVPVYTKNDGTAGARPHYAGQLNGDMSGQAAGNKPAPGTAKPLWPILLEKAYAIHRGGYQGGYADIGDQGGNSPAAMEALTGVASNPPAVVPSTDDGVIQKFKQYQTDHVAVCCGTLDHQSPAAATFTASADGQSFNVQLHAQGDVAGETSEIKKNTVRIHDKKGAVADARDDGKTITGADVDGTKSSVNYGDGSIKVTYKAGKKPGEILRWFFDLRARELYGSIEVLENPRSMRLFRDEVNRAWLTNNCATSKCHGGENAGRLWLTGRRAT